jgi:hypothetical protein
VTGSTIEEHHAAAEAATGISSPAIDALAVTNLSGARGVSCVKVEDAVPLLKQINITQMSMRSLTGRGVPRPRHEDTDANGESVRRLTLSNVFTVANSTKVLFSASVSWLWLSAVNNIKYKMYIFYC